MLKRIFNIKIVRYGVIGGASTLLHISVAYLFLYFIGSSIFISNILGFLFAFIFSYVFQSIYVFEHAIGLRTVSKYFLVQFSSLLTAIVISDYLPLENNYIKTLIIILILPLITYIIHKFWTFKHIDTV